MAYILFTDKVKGDVLSHTDVNEIKQAININAGASITGGINNGALGSTSKNIFKGVGSPGAGGTDIILRSVAAGTGMTLQQNDNDIVFSITDTSVTAGTYTFPKFTVNAQGQITDVQDNTSDIRGLFTVTRGGSSTGGAMAYNNSTGEFTYNPVDVAGEITGGTGVDNTAGTLSIGQDVATTSEVTFTRVNANVTGDVTGDLTGSVTGDVTGDVTGSVKSGDGKVTILNNGTNGTDASLNADVTGDVTGDVKNANGTIVLNNGTGSVPATFEGNVTGNITGNVTGNVTGNITGDLTGDVTGDLTGDVTGDVTGTVSNLNNHDTGALSEGTNKYFTTARARGSVSQSTSTTAAGGGDLAYNNTSGVFTFTPADVGGGAKAAISVVNASGDGSLAYNSTSGEITYTGPSATDTRAHFSVGGGISYSSGMFTLTGTTDQVPEATSPTNKYFTNARAKTALGYSGTDLDTDLTTINTAIGGKAATSHTHAITDVTGLQTALGGKSATGHDHAISDVTNLQTTLDGKLDDITNEQLQDLSNVLVTTPLNGHTLVYDNSTDLWRNEFPAGGTALSACSACDLGDSADVEITSVQTGDTIQWDGTRWVNVDSVGRRNTANVSTSNIADGASDDITIVAAKSYMLQKIETSDAAWVTLYTDAASRTADASRTQTTDPAPGSGVIAEVITSGAGTQLITPGVMGFNNDGTPSDNVYLKVENQSGGAAAITVTLTYVKMEY